ncbi:MAG: hypothetical protein JNG88_16145 [Phycisphaerales bacterium]|nr:hypothetical protein [Phycisphaerales bacterium]
MARRAAVCATDRRRAVVCTPNRRRAQVCQPGVPCVRHTNGATPARYAVTTSGIALCPCGLWDGFNEREIQVLLGSYNGTFLCDQLASDPCIWRGEIPFRARDLSDQDGDGSCETAVDFGVALRVELHLTAAFRGVYLFPMLTPTQPGTAPSSHQFNGTGWSGGPGGFSPAYPECVIGFNRFVVGGSCTVVPA